MVRAQIGAPLEITAKRDQWVTADFPSPVDAVAAGAAVWLANERRLTVEVWQISANRKLVRLLQVFRGERDGRLYLARHCTYGSLDRGFVRVGQPRSASAFRLAERWRHRVLTDDGKSPYTEAELAALDAIGADLLARANAA